MPFYSAEEIKAMLPAEEAVRLAETALLIQRRKMLTTAPRTRMALPPPLDNPKLAGNRLLVQYCYISREAGEFLMTKVSMDAPNNPPRHGLPSVAGIIHCIDPETGFPAAMMDSTYISALRTSGHGALGVRSLARSDSRILGMYGSGVQARMAVKMVSRTLPRIDSILVFSPNRDHRERFAKEMTQETGVEVTPCENPGDAARRADILYCATYAEKPVFDASLVRDGTHVTVVGTYGELDPQMYRTSKVVVHDREACKVDGHLSPLIKRGVLDESSVYAELGEILTGEKAGRESEREKTVYVATGLAVLDAVFARRVLELASARGVQAKQSVNYEAFGGF